MTPLNPAASKNITIDDYLAPEDVHNVFYQPMTGLPIVIIFAVILMLAHALNVYLLLWQGTPIALNIILHLVLVGVAGILVFLLRKTNTDQRFGMLMFVSSAVTGPVGCAGTLLAALQSMFYVRYRNDFEEWFHSIFPQDSTTLPEEIVENLDLGRDEHTLDYSVIPFMDVFDTGNTEQKRLALSRMTAKFHPRFAPAFEKALHDADSSVRVQAATAISKIENQFHDRLLRIARLYRDNPKNPIIVKALADHYDDYAFTGLLDSEREPINRNKAREHYLEYLGMKPEDTDTRLRLGRLLVRSGRVDEAIDWFRQSLDSGYSNDSIKAWYLETLFKAGRYEQLRKGVRTLNVNLETFKSTHPEMIESLRLWASETMGKRAGATA
jgi:polysaccharide biosynthesis protein PelE